MSIRNFFIACWLLISAFVFFQPEKLIYPAIRTDAAGHIIPWSHAEPGAWCHVIRLVWNFWDTMRMA